MEKLSLENAQCPKCLRTGMRTFIDTPKTGDVIGVLCLNCDEEFDKEEIEEFNGEEFED